MLWPQKVINNLQTSSSTLRLALTHAHLPPLSTVFLFIDLIYGLLRQHIQAQHALQTHILLMRSGFG
jgi:hypothetical protein